MPDMRIVDVKNLSCSFRKVLALDDIDFSIEAGKVYGLVGANGAGKTTLLRHILGLYRPQQGTVSVYGLDPVRHPQSVLQRVGYLSEHRDLPEWMKISELLQYLRAYFPTWDMQYAHKLVETFRLDPGKKISELSQGMRAQTGLIAALAHRPELLILDEPSNGLDAVIRLDIIDAIIRTVAEEGRSVLFSSHLLDEMERTCDHVTMIQDGKIAISGELDDIRQEYRVSSIRFPEAPGQIPQLEGTHILASNGHMMKIVHRMTVDSLAFSVNSLGGEVSDSRHASLEEVFLARAGRAPSAREAA
jgi:ABC-2 type transport system ATP-binding protein